jgi:hypothetical protein
MILGIVSQYITSSSLSALGAGDLIDRAVRFYRKFFWTLVLIAAPPVVVGTIISVCWTVIGRQIFSLQANQFSVENTFYWMFLWLGSVLIWLIEMIATLAVMGGASRNFVRHLLFGEAITFAETYRNTWRRLGALFVASTIIAILAGSIGMAIMYFGLIVGLILVGLIAAVFSAIPIVAIILSIAVGIATAFGSLWLFFLGASRVAYVPQVMLVEGRGVFAAIGRSASLASGSVLRLIALFLFTLAATYSALALLYVPLGWYAWVNGVELMTLDADLIPAWYEIASNLIGQISFILLSPVWMIGLCLLYVDERVRAEGYDIELMAAARLGDIPSVPETYVNPLHPALANAALATSVQSQAQSRSGMTTLGLE